MPTAPVMVVDVESSARAIPKSMTRGPPALSSTLAGLKSRCTTPASWIAASAVAVPMARPVNWAPVITPRSKTRSRSEGPSMYSLTMYGGTVPASAARIGAVQNGATRRAAASSRSKPVRARGSRPKSARRIFTATRRPDSDSPR